MQIAARAAGACFATVLASAAQAAIHSASTGRPSQRRRSRYLVAQGKPCVGCDESDERVRREGPGQHPLQGRADGRRARTARSMLPFGLRMTPSTCTSLPVEDEPQSEALSFAFDLAGLRMHDYVRFDGKQWKWYGHEPQQWHYGTRPPATENCWIAPQGRSSRLDLGFLSAYAGLRGVKNIDPYVEVVAPASDLKRAHGLPMPAR